MKYEELAQGLKERQIKAGYITKEKILGLSDKDIIVSYLICSGCGHWTITYEESLDLIKRCKDIGEFLENIANIERGC